MKIFKSWVFGGVRYIALKSVEGEQIVDETGRYFGGWQDHKAFRKAQREARANEYFIAASASLAVRR
jgi:hypothetical protein